MSNHRAFKPRPAEERRQDLRQEWVSIDDGDIVVREMTTKETTILIQKGQRPEQLGGGTDLMEDTLWSLILSCFVSDEPDARPCWSNPPSAEDVRYILGLRSQELGRLTRAIRLVNGLDPEEVEEIQAFTGPSEAGMPSPSSRSASGNSAAALKS